MERIRFLRDIEDETKYAQGLELAYVEASAAIADVANNMTDESEGLDLLDCENPFLELSLQLGTIVLAMSLVIRDCADRRKRLADVARGLSNVVFDEESL